MIAVDRTTIFMENLKDVLKTQPYLVQPIHGVSMLPLLREGKDAVMLVAKTTRLNPLDVALYVRPTDGAYVLHRVISCTPTGYIIRGDNCYTDEVVSEEDVIGVMTGYFHDETFVPIENATYRAYVRRRVRSYPQRKFWFRVQQKIKNICRQIFKKNKSST